MLSDLESHPSGVDVKLLTPDNIGLRTDLPRGPIVFLAGGITGCPNWQPELHEMVAHVYPEVPIFSPRRAGWVDLTGDDADYQLEWEKHWLELADIVSFWFPKESDCPITLYELADMTRKFMYEDKPEILLGCDPEYRRKFDITKQSEMRGYPTNVWSSLSALSRCIIRAISWHLEDES